MSAVAAPAPEGDSKVAELGDIIAKLKPEEARDLRLWFKDTLGIEPAGGGVVQQGTNPEQQKSVEPVATEFNVVYQGFDPAKKLGLIKSIRELLGLGLGEAKALVEGPEKAIKEGVDKAVADDVAKKVTEAGGKVAVNPV